MKKGIFYTNSVILLLFFPLVFLSGFFQNSPDYSLKEAVKVLGLIEKVQQEQLIKGSSEIRNVVVTESELNSYFAHRIETEKEEILKELQCKLFDKNRVEWKVVVDLRGANLPKILKPQMNFFMGGKLEVKDGYVRLDMKDLFLENQRIQVAVFDLVIYIGSRFISSEPFSMSDWWELPYGIKDIQTQQGKKIRISFLGLRQITHNFPHFPPVNTLR